ncbi:MAG: DMT family transporter [Spirochaetes bacterium]|nr:DMT family transporter [Spirochaetota bacterium]
MVKRLFSGQTALLTAATSFAITSLFVKLASRYYSGLFISASRFAIGIVLCAAMIVARKPRLERSTLAMVLLRGGLGVVSMAATYIAISLTGPGRAILLTNIYPVFVGISGALFFKEKMSPKILASLVLCTIGAVFVVRDKSGASFLGDIVALVGAVTAGISVNIVRKASVAGVDPFILYLAPCVFGLGLFAVAPLPSSAGTPVGMLLLFGVGAGAFLAQALMTYGYKTVPANKGSISFYWETALTVALGAIFAGETLNMMFLAGLCFILLGLWVNRSPALDRR